MAAPSQLSPNQASEAAPNEPKKDAAAAPTPSNNTTNAMDTIAAASTDKPEPTTDATSEPPIVKLKDPPTFTSIAAAAAPPVKQDDESLTYSGTQASEAYVLAKHLLQEGDFDNALETIGAEMTRLTSLLPQEEEASIHECMAPLYYLYGTTLLYQMEESTDITAAAGSGGGMTTQDSPSDEQQQQVEDLQIAWENLETARFILEKLVSTTTTTFTTTDLQLDLAQVHLRCGDLLKSNSRLVEAIQDYQKCLEIRQVLLGMYHRKVATLYHALGSVHQLLAASTTQEQQQQDEPPTLSPQQVQEHRTKSMEMFVACAKSFAGQIAFLCGESPQAVTNVNETDLQQSGGKTTGMDASELALAQSSSIIRVLRERVETLTTTATTNTTTLEDNQEETIMEFKELLDEIQETVDEMETSREGIKQVTEMKTQAKQAVSSSDGGGAVENADGSTTTIGFGNVATTSSSTSMAAAASGSSATTTTTATTAKPMMVIKKKKKRDATTDNDAADQKMPAQRDAKRTKTTTQE